MPSPTVGRRLAARDDPDMDRVKQLCAIALGPPAWLDSGPLITTLLHEMAAHRQGDRLGDDVCGAGFSPGTLIQRVEASRACRAKGARSIGAGTSERNINGSSLRR